MWWLVDQGVHMCVCVQIWWDMQCFTALGLHVSYCRIAHALTSLKEQPHPHVNEYCFTSPLLRLILYCTSICYIISMGAYCDMVFPMHCLQTTLFLKMLCQVSSTPVSWTWSWVCRATLTLWQKRRSSSTSNDVPLPLLPPWASGSAGCRWIGLELHV